jgi:glycosyltransferase involved in cell wall biosynthesis
VGYTSKVVDRNDLSDNPHAMVLYQPGNLWVEPDVSEAATWMRWLFDHPEERERIGRIASEHIRANFSLAAAGRAMRLRLEEVNAHVVTLREQVRKGYFDSDVLDAAI